jgi:hypothetical protein
VTPRLEQLLGALEAALDDPAGLDLDGIERALAERQKVLDEIRKTDTAALDAETRRALVERLLAVRARDQQLLEAARARHVGVGEELQGIGTARQAALSYAGARASQPPGVRRRA